MCKGLQNIPLLILYTIAMHVGVQPCALARGSWYLCALVPQLLKERKRRSKEKILGTTSVGVWNYDRRHTGVCQLRIFRLAPDGHEIHLKYTNITSTFSPNSFMLVKNTEVSNLFFFLHHTHTLLLYCLVKAWFGWELFSCEM